MYRNILVPIDGSDAAGRGLQEAIQLARGVGAQLRLLHVVNKTPFLVTGVMPEVIDELFMQQRSTGESILRDATLAVRSAGVEVDGRLIEAPGEQAGKIIIAEAKSWPAHLVVCGTHGRRGLKRLVMGSDAEYVVRHSPVPVLLIRARGD